MKLALIGLAAVGAIVVASILMQPTKSDPAVAQLAAQVEPESAEKAEPATAEPVEDAQEERYMYFEMKTSMGDIYLQLDNELAPITVDNFLTYAESGFYDGTIYHRVMSNFMIQGGGFDKDMNQKKVEDGIFNEWKNGLKNVRGSISMARQGGRPDSATSQFFINVVDNRGLDMPQRDGAGYAVFGRVVKGMEVVDKIREVAVTSKGMHQNVPVDVVLIEKVSRMSDEQVEKAELLESTESDG